MTRLLLHVWYLLTLTLRIWSVCFPVCASVICVFLTVMKPRRKVHICAVSCSILYDYSTFCTSRNVKKQTKNSSNEDLVQHFKAICLYLLYSSPPVFVSSSSSSFMCEEDDESVQWSLLLQHHHVADLCDYIFCVFTWANHRKTFRSNDYFKRTT